jgi:hypothetical protein
VPLRSARARAVEDGRSATTRPVAASRRTALTFGATAGGGVFPIQRMSVDTAGSSSPNPDQRDNADIRSRWCAGDRDASATESAITDLAWLIAMSWPPAQHFAPK